MLKFLTTKHEVFVALDRLDGIYYPGEEIRVMVELCPDRPLQIRSALVRLVGVEDYRYRTLIEYRDRVREEHCWDQHEFYTGEEKFLDATMLDKSVTRQYSLTVPVPADALPSFTGDILQVSWKIDVVLDRQMAQDLHAEADVRIRLRGDEFEPPYIESDESSDSEAAELSFHLTDEKIRTGKTLAGRLNVLPHADFDARVRVELIQKTHVPRDRGNHSERCLSVNLADSTGFVTGQQQVFDFEVPVPDDVVPTVYTPNGSNEWFLRGILDRRLRRDTSIEQGVIIY